MKAEDITPPPWAVAVRVEALEFRREALGLVASHLGPADANYEWVAYKSRKPFGFAVFRGSESLGWFRTRGEALTFVADLDG